MFSCLWQIWDWLDPTNMETKKAAAPSQSTAVPSSGADGQPSEGPPKPPHQHNTAPQHIRLLQYGLKLTNHHHSPTSPHQGPHLHQPTVNPAFYHHLHHQHNQQQQYQQYQQTAHRHLQQQQQQQQQASPSQFNNQLTQNQMLLQTATNYPHHPHQKTQSPLYQTTQPPPPPLHPHSQIAPNSPQIWMPHQPPVHYHLNHQQQQQQQQQQQNQQQQQQQSDMSQMKNEQKSIQIQLKMKDVEKKKSNHCTNLRSPIAKRPPEAPVTMQGWLHKQGSEGLMLWKKRWFVLSEYCLFYYKGSEEEKLLGSILLPSYNVSICGSEDKVNKKFAFKCEHANMRTYILAADTQELMLQWVRVLNLACLLQNNIEINNDKQSGPSVPLPSSTYNQVMDNLDTGFYHHQQQPQPQHQQQYQNSGNRFTPVHMHSSSNTTDLSNPSQQELSQYNQPLYANAPPKPRRLNDGSYSSPSPDVLLDRYMVPNQQSHYLLRSIAKSPINLYTTSQHNISEYNNNIKQQQQQQQYRPTKTVTGRDYSIVTMREIPNAERRTPDTYGRSNPNKNHLIDYEDIYIDQLMYKRPLSPIAYNHEKKINNPSNINPIYRAYTPVNMLGPKDDLVLQQYKSIIPIRKSTINNIARPHSADFLEYELNHRENKTNVLNCQQQRPKSSLDINRYNNNDNDNYFYSEERYAEKMRKSAQYLPKMPQYQYQLSNKQQKYLEDIPKKIKKKPTTIITTN